MQGTFLGLVIAAAVVFGVFGAGGSVSAQGACCGDYFYDLGDTGTHEVACPSLPGIRIAATNSSLLRIDEASTLNC